MHSNLTTSVYIAYSGNYAKGRTDANGIQHSICKITPHQMGGKLTGKQCAVNIFGKVGRRASANYCIGYQGDIVCNVEEENRAWTSSSRWNDCQSITIEISNSANGTDNITQASWNSLINLCVDICKRYNFKLIYDGTKNGTLTTHNMFTNTNCPGTYIKSRLNELVNIVNNKLDEQQKPKEEEFEVAKTYKNGSTTENCYKDSDFRTKTGSLDKWEVCECLGFITNSQKQKAYIVKYKINNRNEYALGFVKYSGGVK